MARNAHATDDTAGAAGGVDDDAADDAMLSGVVDDADDDAMLPSQGMVLTTMPTATTSFIIIVGVSVGNANQSRREPGRPCKTRPLRWGYLRNDPRL